MAMDHFKHKTKKQPFRDIYFSMVGVNASVVALVAFNKKRFSLFMQRKMHQQLHRLDYHHRQNKNKSIKNKR